METGISTTWLMCKLYLFLSYSITATCKNFVFQELDFSLLKLQIEAGGGAETVIEQLKQEKVRYTYSCQSLKPELREPKIYTSLIQICWVTKIFYKQTNKQKKFTEQLAKRQTNKQTNKNIITKVHAVLLQFIE